MASESVKAEVTGKVWKVLINVGDTVAEDDVILIVESMKMEIPVLAEVAGAVTEIVVTAGDVVNDGDPLVIIAPTDR